MVKWKINQENKGLLLRDYLRSTRNISRRMLTDIKYNGGKLVVNDQEVTVRYLLKEGDQVEVTFPPEQRSRLLFARAIPFTIVFEDEDVLVINKPPFLPTVPSVYHPEGTLANGIIHHYDQQQIPYTVHVVTRLDRDTSGLLLVAKHRYSHSILFQQQQHNKVNRRYQAIISGHLLNDEGTISAAIARKPGSIIEREVAEEGQRAITHYSVIEKGTSISIVEMKMETGRTHQIRVHFSSVGHPLIGDSLYGGDTSFLKRQALHCTYLRFDHPVTQKKMTFELPIAEDMKAAWQYYQRNTTQYFNGY
ncbi:MULTISPECIES: RluA family pseudouridine synthase [Gracilibacillus]|uniref:RluA family pseudouridine synthase n=1 Tax=Gracilibacillus TaxID=74385 RepID=UPI0008250465|nr:MULTISPECIES: RluA family pseudouridine synthase [Gracilibacillus]